MTQIIGHDDQIRNLEYSIKMVIKVSVLQNSNFPQSNIKQSSLIRDASKEFYDTIDELVMTSKAIEDLHVLG